jgi:hypothetical protein
MPSDEEVTQRAGSLRALPGLTAGELQALRPHGAPACMTSRQDRTSDGQPRTSRRYRPDDTCPLPTGADTRRFMLTSVNQHPSQEVQGQRLGRSPSQANPWSHLRPPVLKQAVAHPERLPARTAAELAARVKTPRADGSSTAPLVGLLGRTGRSTARPIPKSHKHRTAASRRATRATSSS